MLQIPVEVLEKIEQHFHNMIRSSIAARFIERDGLTLPSLSPLLITGNHRVRWNVPGMVGGFSYWFEGDGPNAKLITMHSSRIWEGSGRRHEITAAGSQLVAEGFV